jgi:acyl-CoA synthetase (AMP-forming)/AMP-acid ligase II
VEFVDKLPKNAMGKTLKAQLRKKYWSDTQELTREDAAALAAHGD